MDIRLILNPVDIEPRASATAPGNHGSQSTASASASQGITTTRDDDDTLSEVSTIPLEEFNTPNTLRRGSSDTVATTAPSTDGHGKQVDMRPIILSPSKGLVYNRRAGASPTRVPLLPAPLRRRRLVDDWDLPRPELETDINRFSIFNTLLNYPELTLEVAKNLDIEDLISLYAISKDFHMLVNSRFTAMITAQWYTKASESGQIFVHRCYKNLCILDPARRVNEIRPSQFRFIPGFRWLRMVLYREAVVDDIMRSLVLTGHRLPKRATLAVKKIWFTIDISDNNRRIGLIHNVNFWTNKDLFLATMFFLKLDMRLTNPATGNGELGLRKMLLGQRSLSTLMRVLKREEMRTQLDMLRMIVRFKYEPERHGEMSILGVPPDEIGKLRYEGWGARKTKFIGIDELVMKEAVRRKLNLQNHYVDMMIYGYINKKTWRDIRTPMPTPVQESESESEDDESEGDEGMGQERSGLFDGDSDEEKESNDEEGKKVEEEDQIRFDVPSKAKIKTPQLGRFRGNPGM